MYIKLSNEQIIHTTEILISNGVIAWNVATADAQWQAPLTGIVTISDINPNEQFIPLYIVTVDG